MNRSTKQLSAVALLATLVAPAYAQTVVSSAAGRLSIVTPNSDQSVKVEVGPAAGSVRLFGFPGIADGAPYAGLTGLSVVTGSGNDKVEVVVESPDSFDVRIDTRSGNSEKLVKWKVSPTTLTPVANITLASAVGGEQKSLVEVESNALSAAINVNAPAESDFAAKVLSSNISESLRVGMTAGAPKTQVEILSAASSLEVDARGNQFGSSNEVKYSINQTRPASVAVNWGLTTSAGSDSIEAVVSSSGSTVTHSGFIRTLGGDDRVKVETDAASSTTGLVLNGGDGNDDLSQIFKGYFQMSQTLETRLIGGNGDDRLTLTTDTAIRGTGIPNDLNPIINCGPGNDTFWAFGIILQCEARY